MKRAILYLCFGLAFCGLTPSAPGQDFSLKGRSSLELKFGLWGGAEASNTMKSNGVQSEAKTSGFNAGLLYAYWLQEYLSVTLYAGFLAGEASSTVNSQGVTEQTSAVVPVLIGVRYCIPHPDPEDEVRPFLYAAVGPYIGFEASNSGLSQEAHSEAAFGGSGGAGIEFFPGRHFLLGVNVGYNLMTNFSAPIGARTNYNGGEFSIGFGYVF